jgi:hypothetical protein
MKTLRTGSTRRLRNRKFLSNPDFSALLGLTWYAGSPMEANGNYGTI